MRATHHTRVSSFCFSRSTGSRRIKWPVSSTSDCAYSSEITVTRRAGLFPGTRRPSFRKLEPRRSVRDFRRNAVNLSSRPGRFPFGSRRADTKLSVASGTRASEPVVCEQWIPASLVSNVRISLSRASHISQSTRDIMSR